ncbi:methylcrotonoyl-CoA carboxylase beta chain, mitochondrial-like isoform X2 [Epinephelus fuscoguttatus]|uniref:methylcrotonoyl-CoA carboxylase beta chain, mitochondrial-like isoform X2 n=1 Tax=Epinephelus fuscoguttatus TaxID=293821 RepID=UPI0020D0163B|nr:methylcrotonoyl-CoA carboxylase beta chain, mitochondrial-like isoform X2 [Epinephelus fuscoguttatus]
MSYQYFLFVSLSLQAEMNSNRLKAQGSMMSAVACASVPKITVVIGGCHGADSYAMCGRAFDPNFLFLWPNARVSMTAPGHAGFLLPPDSEQDEEERKKEEVKLNKRLEEESSAFFSSGRLWDDGVILPQDTRKVLKDCLDIIKQRQYELPTEKLHSALLRI